MANFPHFSQYDSIDCGPSCLQIITAHYGRKYPLGLLRNLCNVGREGVSVLGITTGAEKLGLSTTAIKISFETLQKNATLPCIVHWQQNHFLVVYRITEKYVFLSDPGSSKQKISLSEFKKNWISDTIDNEEVGVAILLETLPSFKTIEPENWNKSESDKGQGLYYFFQHLFKYRKILLQIILGLFAGTALSLILPFFTQGIIDTGIKAKDVDFVILLALGQLAIYAGQLTIEFIQSWLLLYIGARINVTMVSEFLTKIMRMPIKYFDTKLSGDLLQRIDDHKRIEKFLTSKTLGLVFQAIIFIAFISVLAYYNAVISVIYLAGSTLFIGWVIIFLKKRKILDFKRFIELSKNQSKQIEIINGMQDIKLHNAEKQKRWEWQEIQARLFKLNLKFVSLEQYQRLGARLINNIKNIIITVVAARAVISGDLTLGQLIAIQYIIGELNAPLNSAIDFIQSYQEAKISLDRIGEMKIAPLTSVIPAFANDLPQGSITLKNVSFKYDGTHHFKVLDGIDLKIPEGKTTAIVGLSGSGKTTLIKLLMKFYEPSSGLISLGDYDLRGIDEQQWREKCGSVLQDGYIFSDSIARNIALGDDRIDQKRLFAAAKTANVLEFTTKLPLGFNTKIGPEGMGISQGQRQRILIARAVYKSPEYLFFDEATNALDANNEKVIIKNLNDFFQGRTVVVVAHRLSTVRNADLIYVLDKGKIIESGNHQQLVDHYGAYYTLIKNQLELGN